MENWYSGNGPKMTTVDQIFGIERSFFCCHSLLSVKFCCILWNYSKKAPSSRMISKHCDNCNFSTYGTYWKRAFWKWALNDPSIMTYWKWGHFMFLEVAHYEILLHTLYSFIWYYQFLIYYSNRVIMLAQVIQKHLSFRFWTPIHVSLKFQSKIFKTVQH